MRPVKVKPRWRCDFCTRTSSSVKAMAVHEQRCWKNPNRKCQLCDGTGFYDAGPGNPAEPCFYCKQFDPDAYRGGVIVNASGMQLNSEVEP